MKLIDTHTHLYLPEFDADREAVVKRAIESGVERMYLPNVDSETIDEMHALEATFPENCFAMMGLHPCSVKPESYQQELELVKSWLDKRPYVAVGEIGLDLYWDKSTYEIQLEALKLQCEWALEKGLPVVIHSRESTQACIDIIKPYASGGLKGIFHCFSGTSVEAKEITDMGFLLGIGGVLTYKKSTLAIDIKDIPIEFLVLETDAPYLSPVPFRGKRNESSYLKHTLTYLAEARMLGVKELANITTANALALFVHS
jgi:TatD DNase family protein